MADLNNANVPERKSSQTLPETAEIPTLEPGDRVFLNAPLRLRGTYVINIDDPLTVLSVKDKDVWLRHFFEFTKDDAALDFKLPLSQVRLWKKAFKDD